MTPTGGRKLDTEMYERFFPMVRPVIPGLDYFGDWRPAPGVGGDYIDYFEMNDGNLGLAVGDVCGKGVSAAVLTSSLHSMIRALRFARTFSLKVLVRNIDKLFSEVCPDNCYATLFVGEYDPSSARLHYVNAGHEPPFVLRKAGQAFPDPVSGGERSGDRDAAGIVVSRERGFAEARRCAGGVHGWIVQGHQPVGRGMGMAAASEGGGGLRRRTGARHRGGRDANGGRVRRRARRGKTT